MSFDSITSIILIILGIISLFRPVLIVYLFSLLPILRFIPSNSRETGHLIFNLRNINIFAPDYLVFILAILLLCCFSKGKKSATNVFISPIAIAIFAMFFWYIFIGLLSLFKGFSIQNVLRNLSSASLMFIAILIPQIVEIDTKKERLFKFFILIGIIFIIIGLWRYFVSHEFEMTSSNTRRTLVGNDVVILLIPICYILFYGEFWKKHKFLSFIIISLLFVGINFTGHRSGYIVFFFIFGMWLFVVNYGKKDLLWIPLWGISLFTIFLFVLPLNIRPVYVEAHGNSFFSDMLNRYKDTFDAENKTTQERLSKWRYSIDIVKDRPVLGLGRFPVHTSAIDATNFHLKKFYELNLAVHNVFIKKLLHEGLIGLSMFLILIWIIFMQFKKIKCLDKRYYNFLKAYIFAFILYSMFNTSFTSYERIYFFIFVGLLDAKCHDFRIQIGKPFQKGKPV